MLITLDGETGLIEPTPGASLGVVVAHVDAIVRGMGRDVVEMRLDGEPVAADEAGLAGRSPESHERLDVRTMPQLAVVHALVERATTLLPSVEETLLDRAASLRQANVADPVAGLQPIVDVVGIAKNALDLAVDVHLGAGAPARETLAERSAAISACVAELGECLEANNQRAAGWVVGGSLLELVVSLRATMDALGPALPPRPPPPLDGAGS